MKLKVWNISFRASHYLNLNAVISVDEPNLYSYITRNKLHQIDNMSNISRSFVKSKMRG